MIMIATPWSNTNFRINSFSFSFHLNCINYSNKWIMLLSGIRVWLHQDLHGRPSSSLVAISHPGLPGSELQNWVRSLFRAWCLRVKRGFEGDFWWKLSISSTAEIRSRNQRLDSTRAYNPNTVSRYVSVKFANFYFYILSAKKWV